MKTLTERLTDYAAYHRDPRNIATHFVGIPMVVVAVTTLLSRPVLGVMGPVPLSLAVLAAVASALFYLRTELRFGLLMSALLVPAVALGAWLASLSTAVWLGTGVGLFAVGWVFQFVGHYHYEHRKPAFVDDLVGLLVGPMFLVAEVGFALGLLGPVRQRIEARVGPTHLRSQP